MSRWRKRAVNLGSLGGFAPELFVTAWLRNSAPSGALSSLTDVLASNPATQGTAAQQPTGGVGSSIVWDGNDVLTWPVAAGNYNSGGSSLWYALWLRSALSTLGRAVLVTRPDGSGLNNINAIQCQVQANESLSMRIYIDDSNARQGTTPVSRVPDNTPVFVTFEYNGGGATEANQIVITVDGAVQTLTFSNPVGTGNVPATLRSGLTGSFLVGANSITGASIPFTGSWGRNFFAGRAMADVTSGCLTPTARAALRNLDALAA